VGTGVAGIRATSSGPDGDAARLLVSWVGGPDEDGGGSSGVTPPACGVSKLDHALDQRFLACECRKLVRGRAGAKQMISSGSISRVLAFRSYLTQTRIVAVPLSGCSGEPCPSSLALIARRWSVGIASHGQTTGCIRIGYRTTDLSIVRCKTCSIGPARSCTVSARDEACWCRKLVRVCEAVSARGCSWERR
jgi:hypothetical protein